MVRCQREGLKCLLRIRLLLPPIRGSMDRIFLTFGHSDCSFKQCCSESSHHFEDICGKASCTLLCQKSVGGTGETAPWVRVPAPSLVLALACTHTHTHTHTHTPRLPITSYFLSCL
ncbi:rCG35619 [Rattus norvegicus]|uniref:RCG35619 n=1 Tax=Rattus norvegicus TaxID=10116 RepID=A6KF90_RAT|nr:rCG35619 [Rattus norvegicus]